MLVSRPTRFLGLTPLQRWATGLTLGSHYEIVPVVAGAPLSIPDRQVLDVSTLAAVLRSTGFGVTGSARVVALDEDSVREVVPGVWRKRVDSGACDLAVLLVDDAKAASSALKTSRPSVGVDADFVVVEAGETLPADTVPAGSSAIALFPEVGVAAITVVWRGVAAVSVELAAAFWGPTLVRATVLEAGTFLDCSSS